jgi:hypothetical protein
MGSNGFVICLAAFLPMYAKGFNFFSAFDAKPNIPRCPRMAIALH